MTAAPAEPTAPEAPVEPSTAVTTPPEPKPADPPKVEKPPENPWENPTTAQAEIERLRKENAKDRTTAKAQAADDARKELAQTIGKALGLVEDEPIDPAKLTESLTVAQQEAKQAQVALAVYQSAGTAGGDPIALLDSTSFLKSLADVDPTDPAAVQAAIEAAIASNPRLGAAPGEPRVPARNPAQGASAGGTPSLEAQIDAATKAGDIDQAIHLQNQKLALLNQRA